MYRQIRLSIVILSAAALSCSRADLPSFLPISIPGVERTIRGPGSFSLSEPAAELNRLTFYRATLRSEFNGTMERQPTQWSETFHLAASYKPRVRLLTVERTGAPSSRTFVSGEIAGVFYSRDGDKPCGASVLETPIEPTAIAEPARLLLPAFGAEEVSPRESLQGLPVKHYRFDERAIGAEAPTKAAGEIWTAAEGGFVVKYMLRVEGGRAFFGKDIQGTMTWEYELDDVNQAFVVEPPPGCPLGLVDAPRLPNATERVNRPGFLTYKTSGDLKRTIEFYEQQMPAAGWQASEQKYITENLASFEFTQGERRLSLVITSKAGITTVRVLLERR